MASIEDRPPKLNEAEVEAERIDVSRTYEAAKAGRTQPVIVMRPPRPLSTRLFTLLLILVIGVSLLYSWYVSEVDLGKLASKSGNMAQLLGGVITADFFKQEDENFSAALTSPNQPDAQNQNVDKIKSSLTVVQQNAQAILDDINASGFDISKENIRLQQLAANASAAQTTAAVNSDPNAIPTKPQQGQPLVTIEPATANPGDRVTIKGSSFSGNTEVSLNWIGGTGAEIPLSHIDDNAPPSVKTDGSGNFSLTLTVPQPESGRLFRSNLVVASAHALAQPLQPSDSLAATLQSIVVTILLALLASVLAIFFSIPLSFLAARNIMPKRGIGNVIFYVVRLILNIMRSIEVLIVAVIFVAAVGIGPFAGLLALMIHSIASLGKLYSEAIEGIDPGPIEAITATGANRLQVITYAVLPQVIPAFISFTLYRWDINVRMATIVGYVGGGGVGYLLFNYIGTNSWNQAGTVIWAIAIVVIVLDLASSRIREAIV